MKKILIALAFALGSLSAQSETAASASVTVGDITLPQRLAALPDDIFFADKAVARAHIDYTPGDEKTYYYDAKGNQSAEPVSGGYYRKILGKTADGRTVVQDYYQDNGQAQMAPFILRQDAAEDDFRNANADSTLITYTREGVVLIITPYTPANRGAATTTMQAASSYKAPCRKARAKQMTPTRNCARWSKPMAACTTRTAGC